MKIRSFVTSAASITGAVGLGCACACANGVLAPSLAALASLVAIVWALEWLPGSAPPPRTIEATERPRRAAVAPVLVLVPRRADPWLDLVPAPPPLEPRARDAMQ